MLPCILSPPLLNIILYRYLKCCTLCSSSHRILNDSLPWPLFCPHLKSAKWGFGLLTLIPLSSNSFIQVYKCMSCLSRHLHTVQCQLRTSLIPVRPFSHQLSTHMHGLKAEHLSNGLVLIGMITTCCFREDT